MAVDRARVAMVFAAGPVGERVGSGYAVGERLVLTAAHVLSGVAVGDRAEVSLLGSGRGWRARWCGWTRSWTRRSCASMRRRRGQRQGCQCCAGARWPGPTRCSPRRSGSRGRSTAPTAFRDTEHAVGFVPPGGGAETGSLQWSVLSSAPLARPGGGSPWAGMSGAGLVVDAYLVGVVVVDPARYGPDRLVVVPVARLLADAAFAAALGEPVDAVPVGAGWRLEFATGRSVRLAPPYRPLPAGLNVAAARHRLLFPAYNVVPFAGREDLVEDLAGWCTGARRAEVGGADDDRRRREWEDPLGSRRCVYGLAGARLRRRVGRRGHARRGRGAPGAGAADRAGGGRRRPQPGPGRRPRRRPGLPRPAGAAAAASPAPASRGGSPAGPGPTT